MCGAADWMHLERKKVKFPVTVTLICHV